ncbi:MAG: hypothetical protein D6722_24435, partial [Bacteroidetes bacterium]
NNHQIFRLLPEYDFPAWRGFLDHLGASMHPSWHFGYFDRDAYPLAMSANCELIRSGAGPLPFWVTELQGGSNNYSGMNPLTPTATEIAQWVWTSIASGARGLIFWTLNPRSVGFEAGEWGMIDWQGQPTDRLEMAGRITACLAAHPGLAQARPQFDPIHLLYSSETMALQDLWEMDGGDVRQTFAARQSGGHIKSLLAHYQAMLESGITPQIAGLHEFDWENHGRDHTLILPNMTVLPRAYHQPLRDYVARGGKLVLTGQSGHLDEYRYNTFQGDAPLAELLGGHLLELRVQGDRFETRVEGQPLLAHYLQGVIEPATGAIAGEAPNGTVTALRHTYGQGETLWVPAPLGLAVWGESSPALAAFWRREVSLPSQPVRLAGHYPGLMIRQLQAGNTTYTVLVQTDSPARTLRFDAPGLRPEVVFQSGAGQILDKRSVHLGPASVLVLRWAAKE